MSSGVDWRRRITSDPTVHHGDPRIAGTRVPVSVIVGSVADGDSFDDILRSYPALTREDIQATLQCAAEASTIRPSANARVGRLSTPM